MSEIETDILLAQQIKPASAGRILVPDAAGIRRWGEFMAPPDVRAGPSVAVDVSHGLTPGVTLRTLEQAAGTAGLELV